MRQRLVCRLGAGVAALAAALTVAGTATALPFPPAPTKFTITPAADSGICATVERRGIHDEHIIVPRPCDPANVAQQFTYDSAAKNLKSVARSGDCVTVQSNGYTLPTYVVEKCGNRTFPQQYNPVSDARIQSEPTRAIRAAYCMTHATHGGGQAILPQECNASDNQNFVATPAS